MTPARARRGPARRPDAVGSTGAAAGPPTGTGPWRGGGASAGPGPSPASRNGQDTPWPRPAGVALRVDRLTKTFPGGKALDDVTFSLGRDQVHAILGGNGSGKSTLVKALAGIQPADAGGFIAVGDSRVPAEDCSPSWARAHGIRFVHQDPGLFGELSVQENFALGHRYPTRRGVVSWRQLRRSTQDMLDRFHVKATPNQTVAELRPSTRTMIAIARAVQDKYDTGGPAVELLVLDEPTAALPDQEVDLLLASLREYTEQGIAVVFISHRLDEVLAVAQTVTVLRDGRLQAQRSMEHLTDRDLVELILGEPAPANVRATARRRSDGGPVPVASLDHVATGPIRDVSMYVAAGEVLGLAGLLGSGRTELLELLFGCRPPDRGMVTLDDRSRPLTSPARAMREGVAYVPEHRSDAVFPSMTVGENLTLPDLAGFGRWLLHPPREAATTEQTVKKFRIKTVGAASPISFLSGGNQQKVVLARWLNRRPKLLLLDEPTQGVDVGARADAHAMVRQAAAEGMAVIVASSDFIELEELCDRVVVLSAGTVAEELAGTDLSAKALTRLVHSSAGG